MEDVLVSYLDGGEAEEDNANGSVDSVSDSLGLATKLETGGPTGDPDDVAGGLAQHVQIEPGGVR